MTVEVSNHVDASEPDAGGFYDYHYEYDVYEFTDGIRTLMARAYSDEPGKTALTGWTKGGKNRLLTKRDLRHPLFLEAVTYLYSTGKSKLDWLDSESRAHVPLANPGATLFAWYGWRPNHPRCSGVWTDPGGTPYERR